MQAATNLADTLGYLAALDADSGPAAEEPLSAAAAAELLLKSGAVHSPFVDDNDTLPNESENESVVSDDGDVPDSCAPTSLEWPGEAFLYLVGAALTARIWPGFPPPP